MKRSFYALTFIGLMSLAGLAFAAECLNDDHPCPNPGGMEGQRRCAEQVCLQLERNRGCYEVDRDIWRACEGNLDYACTFRVCERVQGGFDGCDKKENALTAARLCRNVFDDCIIRHCEMDVTCDEFTEVKQVIDQYCRF